MRKGVKKREKKYTGQDIGKQCRRNTVEGAEATARL
jgi:hypothetical protein